MHTSSPTHNNYGSTTVLPFTHRCHCGGAWIVLKVMIVIQQMDQHLLHLLLAHINPNYDSNAHKSTWMEAKSQPCSVAARLDTAYQQQVKKNREYMKIIIQTLMFLAKHNIAIRGHDESLQSTNHGNFLDLLDLRSKDDPLLQEYLRLRNSVPPTHGQSPHE